MPLRELHNTKSRNGMVPIGAMSNRITIEGEIGEIWAHVSLHRSVAGTQGEFTAHYIQGVRTGMAVTHNGTSYRITRVIELGNRQQMKLLVDKVGETSADLS